MKKILFILIATVLVSFKAGTPSFKIALLKYNGGGDWYANLETSLPNLISFCMYGSTMICYLSLSVSYTDENTLWITSKSNSINNKVFKTTKLITIPQMKPHFKPKYLR